MVAHDDAAGGYDVGDDRTVVTVEHHDSEEDGDIGQVVISWPQCLPAVSYHQDVAGAFLAVLPNLDTHDLPPVHDPKV